MFASSGLKLSDLFHQLLKRGPGLFFSMAPLD